TIDKLKSDFLSLCTIFLPNCWPLITAYQRYLWRFVIP
ncbi:MAG: hypothetical protein ACJAUL_003984, partial [Paraglaciecola sp.]